jgi:Caspase domain
VKRATVLLSCVAVCIVALVSSGCNSGDENTSKRQAPTAPSVAVVPELVAPMPATVEPATSVPNEKDPVGQSPVGIQNRPRRFAFIVGNNNYVDTNLSQLRSPQADAQEIGRVLREADYFTEILFNSTKENLRLRLANFVEKLSVGDEVMVYFSGHGFQFDEALYLAQIDTRSQSAEQARAESVRLADIVQQIESKSPSVLIAIIDACRSTPFSSEIKSTLHRKTLIPEANLIGNPKRGRLFAMSSSAGQASIDTLGQNDNSPFSLFSRVLLEEIIKPGVSMREIMPNIRNRVAEISRGYGREQRPALIDELVGDYVLYPKKNHSNTAPERQRPNSPLSEPKTTESLTQVFVTGSAAKKVQAINADLCMPGWPKSGGRAVEMETGEVNARLHINSAGTVEHVDIASSSLPYEYIREVKRKLKNCHFDPSIGPGQFELQIEYKIEN